MSGRVQFVCDGAQVEVDAAPGETLLSVLREHLGIMSVKDGCAPQGQCGCCTVLVDGAARVACVTPVARIAGRAVTTVDGLPDSERDALTAAFVATGGSQCGFCTPGIVVRAAALRAKGATTKVGVDRGARRAPLPLHRMAHGDRCDRDRCIFGGCGTRRARTAGGGVDARRVGGRRRPARGSRRRVGSGRVRGRHRAARRARRGATAAWECRGERGGRGSAVGRRRLAVRRARACGQGAGPAHDRRRGPAAPAPGVAGGRCPPRDELGRAGVPGAGRVLVPCIPSARPRTCRSRGSCSFCKTARWGK